MRDRIDAFIACKRLALVGVSRSGRKFGDMAADELERRGYEILPVHPAAAEAGPIGEVAEGAEAADVAEVARIGGRLCARSLQELVGRVDAVLISVSPSVGAAVLRDVAAAGLTHVWLQQGAEDEELIALARQLGLAPVVGRCILMYAPPVRSFHRLHRGVVRAFGRLYPKRDPFAGPTALA